jgi:hypothetical protein
MLLPAHIITAAAAAAAACRVKSSDSGAIVGVPLQRCQVLLFLFDSTALFTVGGPLGNHHGCGATNEWWQWLVRFGSGQDKLVGSRSNAGWNETGASIVTEQFSSCQTAL